MTLKLSHSTDVAVKQADIDVQLLCVGSICQDGDDASDECNACHGGVVIRGDAGIESCWDWACARLMY